MNPLGLRACAIGLGLCALATPAGAAQQVFTYAVMHPIYGEIGTFTDTIDRVDDLTRIDSHLRVAVRMLGIVAYREESDSTELLRGNRLVALESHVNKDGTRLEVRGEARGEEFLVNSTSGSRIAPANVAPSDPWVLKGIGVGTVVSTTTGKVVPVRVSGGEQVTIPLRGGTVTARHFTVVGDKRQEVWLDSHDIPVMFRTHEDGAQIDFVLKTPLPDGSAEQAATPTASLQADDSD